MSTLMSPALSGPEVVEAPFGRQRTGGPIKKAVRKRPQLLARDAATAVTANPTGHHELSQRIAVLNEITAQQLRNEWRRLYRGQPPRLSRDLLIRTIAYRMQELAYGGLSKAKRKLDALSKGARIARPRSPSPAGLIDRCHTRTSCQPTPASAARFVHCMCMCVRVTPITAHPTLYCFAVMALSVPGGAPLMTLGHRNWKSGLGG